MGIVGAAVILHWSIGLMRDTGGILLDMEAGGDLAARIRTDIEAKDGDRVADLHVWRVGPGPFRGDRRHRHASARPMRANLKTSLKARYPLAHLTVEVLATAPRDEADSVLRES